MIRCDSHPLRAGDKQHKNQGDRHPDSVPLIPAFDRYLTYVTTGGSVIPKDASNKEITIFEIDPENPSARTSIGTCTADSECYYHLRLVPFSHGPYVAAYIDGSGVERATSSQSMVIVEKMTVKTPIGVPLPVLK